MRRRNKELEAVTIFQKSLPFAYRQQVAILPQLSSLRGCGGRLVRVARENPVGAIAARVLPCGISG
jgi:hypothetical protein